MNYLKAILLLTLVGVLSAFTLSGSGYKVGDIADDFKLKNVNGKMVSMSDYKDAEGFIIVFTCNTCPYSVANEDRLNALDAKYKSKGYPVIAINPNNPTVQPGDSFEKMVIRAKEKQFTFPYLLDEGQTVFPKYGATRTPHVYILKHEQEGLRVKYIGAIDDSSRNEAKVKTKYVEDAVDALLEGQEIKTTNTKAIGCSIKV